MSVELVMLANHLILCCLLLLPSVFPNIRVFSSELAFCIWWPKYWSFSISINPSNEYSELISFRIDWFDLLADQGTLKSLQNHSWKVSILQNSAFFVVQCSHPYTVSQSLSCVRLFATPWNSACQACLSISNSQSLLKLMSIESVMPSNHLILCCPLLLPPSIFPSIRVFLKESVLCIRWPKYWSFSFSINPSNEYSGLIAYRMDWLNLLAIQGSLKSLLQHHTSKASILLCSAFFIVQLSHPYMTTGKTIALTRWTFVGKIMSLLFNMLSRLVITFLPWSNHLLISWLQSPSTVILEPKKVKSVTVPLFSHLFAMKWWNQIPWP